MLNQTELKGKMDKTVAIFVGDIGTIRTGRATPALLENVMVTAYGNPMKLIELGSIGVSDARTLTFVPWDMSVMREVSNGIAAANLGMNPVVDGEMIRMSLPMLTTQQREEFVKLLGRKLEGARGIIRDIRANARKGLQDEKQKRIISEDMYKRDEDTLQKITDEYIGKLEDLAKKKEVEIRG